MAKYFANCRNLENKENHYNEDICGTNKTKLIKTIRDTAETITTKGTTTYWWLKDEQENIVEHGSIFVANDGRKLYTRPWLYNNKSIF